MEFTFPKGEEVLPGEMFFFGVGYSPGEEGRAPILVEVRVEGAIQDKLTCPDPPCHEMSFFIQPAWENSTLDLTAHSMIAEPVAISLAIGRPMLA